MVSGGATLGLSKAKQQRFSDATVRMVKKGLIGLIGPIVFSWWVATILVRGFDQFSIPNSTE